MPNIRKPNEMHKLEGTFRKDRHGGDEIQIEQEIPAPPNWLDQEAMIEWVRIVLLMDEYKMLKATDMVALATYCCLYSCMQRQRDAFPSSKMSQLRGIMNDLGLNPTARSRIKVPTTTKASSFDNI